MEYTISKTFKFSASHRLDPANLPEGHSCARLHGHDYEVTVQLAATELDANGFVRDYNELAPLKRFLDEFLDHRHLGAGDVYDADGNVTAPAVVAFNPTAENLAAFLLSCAQGMPFGHLVSAVEVKETASNSAVVYP